MTNVFLFLAITSILITSPLVMTEAFAKNEPTEDNIPIIPFSQCENDPPMGISDGGTFLEIWDAVCLLKASLDNTIDDFQDQIDDLVIALATETSERKAADTQLSTDLATETSERKAADTVLQAAIDADGDTDSSNEDQTLSGTGEVVLGTTAAGDGGGTVTCADITGDASLCDSDDADTTYSGSDFATSGQSCGSGKVVTGVSSSGAVTCATDKDTDTNTTYSGSDFATSGQSCAADEVVTGVDVNGAVTCATDANSGFPSTYWVTGTESVSALARSATLILSCDNSDDKIGLTGFKGTGFNLNTVESRPNTFTSGGFTDHSWRFEASNRNVAGSETLTGYIQCLDFGTAHVP